MQNRRIVAAGLLGVLYPASEASADVQPRFRRYRQVSRSMLPTIEPRALVRGGLGPIVLDPEGPPASSPPTSTPIRVVRADLVLFRPPGWENQTWIFRVIGFPGESIEIRDRVVFINGASVRTDDLGPAPNDPSYYVDAPAAGYRAGADTARFVRETLPNGSTYRTLQLHTNFDARLTNMASQTVPEGRLFLLGDNRDNANDSRLPYLGMLPADAVLGKVLLG